MLRAGKRFGQFVVILIVLAVMFGCAQNVTLFKDAQRNYNRGNYDAAFDANIRSLQLKPAYAKSQNLLLQVYPAIIRDKEEEIQSIHATQAPDRWPAVVEQYLALQSIQDRVRRLPRLINPDTGLALMFDYRDYSALLLDAKTNAAEHHYQQGLHLSRSGSGLDQQKQAALEFRAALSFMPNYKDAVSRFEEARRNAIKRIAVVPFEDLTGSRSRYGDLASILIDQIISNVLNDPTATEFVEIITRDQLNPVLLEQQLSASGLVDENTASEIGVLVGAHEILTGKLTQIAFIQPRITRDNDSETKRVVTGREEYVDDNGNTQTRDLYSDVTCNFTRYTKTASAQITGTYNIIDVATGRIKRQGTYTAESPWSDTWARKESGDDRALSSATAALIRKSEPNPPAEIELINGALSRLSQNIINEFKSYIR